MKQDSMEKRFKRMIKAVRIGKCLVIVNHSTEILAFIKQEMGRVIGEDEVEFKVNGKQKLEYKASDSYYNPVRNQLKAEQRREVGIK